MKETMSQHSFIPFYFIINATAEAVRWSKGGQNRKKSVFNFALKIGHSCRLDM